MKKEAIQLSETAQMVKYLKEQISIFSRMPNKSERMAGYYKDELNQLVN